MVQGAPIAKAASATLTIAELLTGIVQVTSASAVTQTLPTGTLTDAGLVPAYLVDECFDWHLQNKGSSTGAVTMAAGTGHSFDGNATVAINTAAHLRTRKTAANTFITYRVV